ncbi:MAG: T9SS type A sorting domain-containing protein [Chitinophagaceae bacterium]|nr:T9SS type A sorting domain-containing protein [Chitinophagaceae bacterium]
MKSNTLLITLFCFFILKQTIHAQTYDAIDWGTYLNDSANFPNYSYSLDELVDQLVVDDDDPEHIYVVSQSKAPPKIDVNMCTDHIMDLGGGDGYIAKYKRCGELIWSVYIGDFIQCIALDKENGKTILYVAGKKGYVVSPVAAFACDGNAAPVFQPNAADKDDAFIAKFIDNGSSATLLRWTYFGGKTASGTKVAPDNILSIAVNRHKVFFTGSTKSYHLDTLAQHVGDVGYNDNGDGFLGEFDSLLSTLMFFTYMGSNGNDRCHDVKVYDNGSGPIDLFVSGTTDSPADIASGSGFDLSYNEGTDAFLCKWEDNDLDGKFTQTWGTYLGGTNYDHGRQMDIDQDGNLFITLWGQSDDLPVTDNAYDKDFGIPGQSIDGSDASIFKISNSGSLMLCTYFGGNYDDMVNGLVVFKKQSKQYIVIAGLTKTPGNLFPLKDAVQTMLNGNNTTKKYDAFIAVLNDPATAKQKLIYSTYLGGTGEEGQKTGSSYHPVIALGPSNELYFSVATNSADINTVAGSNFQQLKNGYSGGSDAFIAKLINLSDAKQYNCPTLKKSADLASVESNQEKNMLVYPNPFKDQFHINYKASTEKKYSIQVFNYVGKLVWSGEYIFNAGMNDVVVELPEVSSGLYLVNISTGDSWVNRIVSKNY